MTTIDNSFPIDSVTGASITGKYFTRVSEGQTGWSNARNFGGGYWEISLDLQRKSRDEHDKIFAFLNKQQGRFHEFDLCLPEYSQTKGNYIDEILVNNPNNLNTGNTINIHGLIPSRQNILKAGDFIQFENHSKVYILTQDVHSDNSGNATLEISPNLVEIPIHNAQVIYSDINWKVRNTTDDISLNLDLQIKASWSLTFREVW